MKNIKLVTFFLLVVTISTNCIFRAFNADCCFKGIQTIFTDVGIHVGVDTSYEHFVLISKYSKDCNLDSTEFMKIIMGYIDTVDIKAKPVGKINVYRSKERFIPHEKSQICNDVNKDCIVSVWINNISQKPYLFEFYDKNGESESLKKTWKVYTSLK
jgi:hypothetical protein